MNCAGEEGDRGGSGRYEIVIGVFGDLDGGGRIVGRRGGAGRRGVKMVGRTVGVVKKQRAPDHGGCDSNSPKVSRWSLVP